MSSQTEIRQQITNRIVEALKGGTVPWRRPWSDLTNTGIPANVASKRPYSGVNPLVLALASDERGYQSRWWGTFRQWSDLGFRVKARPANVKSGEWGTKIVFCKPIKDKGDEGDEDGQGDGDERRGRTLFLRTFTVFNAEQVEGNGIEHYLAQPRVTTGFIDFSPAEAVIAVTEADIRHGGDKAVYHPGEDYIRLPLKEVFESQKEYYSAAFHELAHWTGHASRLARLVKNSRFGDDTYAFEELVAEIGGCFLCSEVGIPQSNDLSNQAAYLASWLQVLQDNPSAIFTAASQASAAADFILTFSRKDDGKVESVAAIIG